MAFVVGEDELYGSEEWGREERGVGEGAWVCFGAGFGGSYGGGVWVGGFGESDGEEGGEGEGVVEG